MKGIDGCRYQRRSLLQYVIISTALVFWRQGNGFNINTERPNIYRGPTDSYFGYSISSIENSGGDWLLIGAPRSHSTCQRQLSEPGAVYRCSIGNPEQSCEQLCFDKLGNEEVNGNITTTFNNKIYKLYSVPRKDHQYFGATLVANSTTVVACSPLFSDKRYHERTKHREFPTKVLPIHGACYTLGKEFNYETRSVLMPLTTKKFYFRQYATGDVVKPLWKMVYGQVGFSADLFESENSLILGSPGMNDWTGGTLVYGANRDWLAYPYRPSIEDSLIGYAVSSGTFGDGKQLYLSSAPHLDRGKVFFFEDNITIDHFALTGEQFGSYYGAALCVLDLNNNGIDDVLVGAPLFSGHSHDEGRVYVYKSLGSLNTETRSEVYAVLSGSEGIESRFGSCIASVGDLNGDSYPDVAIGAPYEEEGKGCIYIYQGSEEGLWNSPFYSQRICASKLKPSLKGFGFSLHGTLLNRNTDGNIVFAGAYASQEVVSFTVRPIISIKQTLENLPSSIEFNKATIRYNGERRSHVGVFLYLTNTNLNITEESLEITMEGDIYRLDQGLLPRGHFLERPTVDAGPTQRHCPEEYKVLSAEKSILKIRTAPVVLLYCFLLNKDIADVMTPMVIRSSVKMDLNNSKGAVQDVMISPNVTLNIPFIRACGEDNQCRTDVSVAITPFADYFVEGSNEHVSFSVTVKNTVEKAYLVRAFLEYSDALQYVNCRVKGKNDCFCTKLDGRNRLQCKIGHPLLDDTKRLINLNFSYISPSKAYHQTVEGLRVNVSTSSEDVDTENNYAECSIPVLYNPSPFIRSKSLPEELFFDRSSEEDKNNPQNRTSFSFHHFYEIENRGLGALPPGSLQLTLPTSGSKEEKFAVAHVQMEQTLDGQIEVQNCATPHEIKKRDTGSKKSKLLPTFTEPAIFIGCEGGYSCITYICNHHIIPPGGIISINVAINMSIPMERTDYLTYASNILIKYPRLYDFSSESDQVETVFIYKRRKGFLPAGTVPIALVAGLAIMAIIIFALFKLKFFQRPHRMDKDMLLPEQLENDTEPNEDETFVD